MLFATGRSKGRPETAMILEIVIPAVAHGSGWSLSSGRAKRGPVGPPRGQAPRKAGIHYGERNGPRFSGRKPGSMSATGTGLRRCDKKVSRRLARYNKNVVMWLRYDATIHPGAAQVFTVGTQSYPTTPEPRGTCRTRLLRYARNDGAVIARRAATKQSRAAFRVELSHYQHRLCPARASARQRKRGVMRDGRRAPRCRFP